jgi:hypothetical protein
VILGVPMPIALMAGYCTFVGAVCLGLIPMAYRALSTLAAAQQQTTIPPDIRRKPNYVAVRLMHEYHLNDAAKLWCDFDQNENGTHESQSWQEALSAAIQRGELKFKPKIPGLTDADERADPRWDTIVTRSALKEYAVSISQDPPFLRGG